MLQCFSGKKIQQAEKAKQSLAYVLKTIIYCAGIN